MSDEFRGWTGSAHWSHGTGEVRIEPVISPWNGIIPIARRLGIKPVKKGGPPRVIVRTENGDYDIFEIITAVLNRIDEVS